jgi:hypothetical protein
MLSLDQILRELKAIEDFDALFLTSSQPCPEEVIGSKLREIHKRELLALAESLNSGSAVRDSCLKSS